MSIVERSHSISAGEDLHHYQPLLLAPAPQLSLPTLTAALFVDQSWAPAALFVPLPELKPQVVAPESWGNPAASSDSAGSFLHLTLV